MRYLLLTLLIALLAVPAGAAPKDPEADLKRVKQRIEKLQRSVREDVARRDKLSANLRESEEAVAAARRRLDDVRGRIRESDERLAELAGERTRAEKRLEEQRDQLAAALRTAYVTGKEEHLKLLLSQKDPAALGRMLVYYSYLGKARAGRIGEIEQVVARIGELATEEETEREKLAALEAEREQEVAAVEAARKDREKTLAAVKGQIKSNEDTIARLKREARALEKLIADLRKALDQAPAPSGQPFERVR
jgi:septal ring factor EnvC (AmiA/AmiB activator)